MRVAVVVAFVIFLLLLFIALFANGRGSKILHTRSSLSFTTIAIIITGWVTFITTGIVVPGLIAMYKNGDITAGGFTTLFFFCTVTVASFGQTLIGFAYWLEKERMSLEEVQELATAKNKMGEEEWEKFMGAVKEASDLADATEGRTEAVKQIERLERSKGSSTEIPVVQPEKDLPVVQIKNTLLGFLEEHQWLFLQMRTLVLVFLFLSFLFLLAAFWAYFRPQSSFALYLLSSPFLELLVWLYVGVYRLLSILAMLILVVAFYELGFRPVVLELIRIIFELFFRD